MVRTFYDTEFVMHNIPGMTFSWLNDSGFQYWYSLSQISLKNWKSLKVLLEKISKKPSTKKFVIVDEKIFEKNLLCEVYSVFAK